MFTFRERGWGGVSGHALRVSVHLAHEYSKLYPVKSVIPMGMMNARAVQFAKLGIPTCMKHQMYTNNNPISSQRQNTGLSQHAEMKSIFSTQRSIRQAPNEREVKQCKVPGCLDHDMVSEIEYHHRSGYCEQYRT